ncbi:MAG: ribonuclease P protein component [Flavobacteriales bacterium]|jgi:ribonuclease P protein component
MCDPRSNAMLFSPTLVRMENHAHSRDARLKSKKQIEELFASGSSIKKYPLLLVWRESSHEAENVLQTGFTVSKRNFKHAVDRNRIKRQMLEVFRCHKHPLIGQLKTLNKHVDIMWIYTGRELPDFTDLESKILFLLDRFSREHPFSE